MNPGLIPFSWKLAGGWRSALIAALAFVRSGGCSGLAQGLADRFKSWAEKNTIPHGVVPELIGSGDFFFRTPHFCGCSEAQGNLLVSSCCEINDDFSFVCQY